MSAVSASESAVSDCEDTLPAQPRHPKAHQQLMSEMAFRSSEKRRRVTSPQQPSMTARGENAFLSEMRTMIDESISAAVAGLWGKIEKFTAFEHRVDVLESEIFKRDQQIDGIEKELRVCRALAARNEERLNEAERYSRSANLVLTYGRFGRRREGEDIAKVALEVLTESFPESRLSKDDFSAIHRLSAENAVICAFRNKALRNQLYSERLSLRDQQADVKKRLYLSENLSKPDAENFTRLLALKREGRIYTAFTRGGIPAFKLRKESRPTRIFSGEQPDRIIENLPGGPPERGGPRDGRVPSSRPPPPRRADQPPAHAGRGGVGSGGWRGGADGRRRRVSRRGPEGDGRGTGPTWGISGGSGR